MDIVEAFNQSGVFAKLSLLAGLVPPGVAIVYAVRPTERKLAFMRPVSLAAIFAGISGLTAGLIAVLLGVAATPQGQIGMSHVYLGLSEAIVPAFMNFGFLAMAWLLVAAGMLRRTTFTDVPGAR
jgi:hypothetical protein